MTNKDIHTAYFNYIDALDLPIEAVNDCSASGDCTYSVRYWMQQTEIKKQLSEIDPEQLIKELNEYGAWDEKELSNHTDNLERILWIASGNISDEICTE